MIRVQPPIDCLIIHLVFVDPELGIFMLIIIIYVSCLCSVQQWVLDITLSFQIYLLSLIFISVGSHVSSGLHPSESLCISPLHFGHSLHLAIILDCKNYFWAGNFFLGILKTWSIILWPQHCYGGLLSKPLWFLCLLRFLWLWNLAFFTMMCLVSAYFYLSCQSIVLFKIYLGWTNLLTA